MVQKYRPGKLTTYKIDFQDGRKEFGPIQTLNHTTTYHFIRINHEKKLNGRRNASGEIIHMQTIPPKNKLGKEDEVTNGSTPKA